MLTTGASDLAVRVAIIYVNAAAVNLCDSVAVTSAVGATVGGSCYGFG